MRITKEEEDQEDERWQSAGKHRDFAGNISRHWHAARDYSYISKDRYKLFPLPALAAYPCLRDRLKFHARPCPPRSRILILAVRRRLAQTNTILRAFTLIFFFLLENVCANDVSTEPRVRSSFARLLPFSSFGVYLRDRIRKQPAFSFFYREFHDSLPRHSTHPFELAYLLRSARWKSR